MAEMEKDDENGVDLFPDKYFQLVLKKNRRNREALTLSNTRPRLDFKLFAVNNRDILLPNIWFFCKYNLEPSIVNIDDQHINFTIDSHNTTLGFSVIYASTSYVHRRYLKDCLKVWNKLTFGNVHDSVSLAEGYSDFLQERETKAQLDFEKALYMEGELWREKSRINWHLQEKHIENHFKNLFNCDFVDNDYDLIQRVIPYLVNEQMNDRLLNLPSPEEIHSVVLNLNIDSALNPDGFGAIFFSMFWEIIKLDVINDVNQFLLREWILPNLSANNLIMLPKFKDASSISHYRPIAIANVKYKIISKILADRLSSILPTLISPEQKGFIAGRNIKDDICLTSETINLLGNKSFSGNVALKIDITKAFDSLNWNFIFKTLTTFVFYSKFFSWIHTLLNSANLSIGLNGNQGHVKSLTSISKLLKDYAFCSSQICNSNKSIIYAGGMAQDRHNRLAAIIGFSIDYPPFVYLGVPIFIGKPKSKHLSFLADNIKIKLASWKVKMLSMAGRLMLVKSVIHSMMVHCISIYNLPSTIISNIERWMRNFI
ncbi:uncharacterized protein LOC131597478 [Vicia villosa]|uniref:uncharacterized protein LOC131597478 n=1 Tax=Vicia villosa TaxID=3911 RepID=UPI00273C2F70|nr:uncharacterized protein LOC131597478 [Vicia villosa]